MAATVNLRGLRALVQQHLNSALDELFENLQKTFTEYEQEISRQRRLVDLLTERRAPESAGRSGPRLHLLTEGRVPSPAESDHSAQSDPWTRPGSEGESFCTVTVKTEEQVQEQPLTEYPLQIQVHSPVQTQNQDQTPNRDQVQSRVLTKFQTQHLQPDERFVKEEASQDSEMELDSDMVLDYNPLTLMVLNSESPQDTRGDNSKQDPGHVQKDGVAFRNQEQCGLSSAQSATEKTTREMASSSKPAHYWSDEETGFMLAKLKEFEIAKCLDGRKKRNGNLFRRVSCALADAGFVRTAEQIRVRWKHVKKAYYDVQRQNKTSGSSRESCPHMKILEDLLAERPSTQTGQHGVESNPRSATAPEPDDMPYQSSLVSTGDAGDPTSSRVNVLYPDDRSVPNVSSPNPPRRSRTLPSSAALDSYVKHLDRLQKRNAERHMESVAQRERHRQENKELLQHLADTNKVLVDLIMGTSRQPPTAPGPRPSDTPLSGQTPQAD